MVAALAIRFTLVWIDVGYPLVAIWLLTGLLAGGATAHANRTQGGLQSWFAAERAESASYAAAPTTETERFDVFFSYSRQDEGSVLELGEALKERGITVWLDVWEIPPGVDWQRGIEDGIVRSGSAAVMVGGEGELSPWEVPEMRACINEAVTRGMIVMPVLLPDAPKQPELPIFLKTFNWLDLRGGLTTRKLERMEWGITSFISNYIVVNSTYARQESNLQPSD